MANAPPPPPPATRPAPPPPPANGAPAATPAPRPLNGSRPVLSAMLAPVREGYKPPITVLIGPQKSGKSTLAAGANNPIFVLSDPGGLNGLPDDIPRILVEAWDLTPGEKVACVECGASIFATLTVCSSCQAAVTPKLTVMGAAQALLEEPHEHGAIAFDTINKMEMMLWDFLCRQEQVKSIRKVDKGFGAGFDMAREHMTKLFDLCARIRERKGCEIFAMAHQDTKKEHDASGTDFEQWMIDMNKKAGAVWLGGADIILFIEKESKDVPVQIQKMGTTETVMQREYTGRSVAYSRPTRGREAGNRYCLPAAMWLGYGIFKVELEKGHAIQRAMWAKLRSMEPTERAKAETYLAEQGWTREAHEHVIKTFGNKSSGNK